MLLPIYSHPFSRYRPLLFFLCILAPAMLLTVALTSANNFKHAEQPPSFSLPPKVALLFLTKGPMPLSPFWLAWLQGAAYKVPIPIEVNSGSSSDGTAYCDAAAAATAADTDTYTTTTTTPLLFGSSTIDQQQVLYSIYVHSPPSFQPQPNTTTTASYWYKKRITMLTETAWGDISLTVATRRLLAAALEDPLNQAFLLVSESDVPLYDPLTLYSTLLSEDRSRINACPVADPQQSMIRRWSDVMKTPRMNSSHWRKSSQWWSLRRKHAELVVRDVEVFDSFAKHCHYDFDGKIGRVRDCISDEHYIPTLLAVEGIENETVCGEEGWGVAAVDWSRGGAHPKSYRAREVSVGLMRSLRGVFTVENGDLKAQLRAQRQFCSLRPHGMGPLRGGQTGGSGDNGHGQIGYGNPLTARKFTPDSVHALEKVARECLSVTDGDTGDRHRKFGKSATSKVRLFMSSGLDDACI